MDPRITDRFLVNYSRARNVPFLADEMLRRLIGVRRLIEIQLDLYELRNGGPYDLEYCSQNIRGLRNLHVT